MLSFSPSSQSLRLAIGQLGAALAVAACGSVPETQAPTATSDASFDAPIPVDPFATPDADAARAPSDGGCTPSDVMVGLVDLSDAAAGCKFDVTWKCGDTSYRVGGGCDREDASSGGVARGVCVVGEAQTGTFEVPVSTCSCNDLSALVTEVREHCMSQ